MAFDLLAIFGASLVRAILLEPVDVGLVLGCDCDPSCRPQTFPRFPMQLKMGHLNQAEHQQVTELLQMLWETLEDAETPPVQQEEEAAELEACPCTRFVLEAIRLG